MFDELMSTLAGPSLRTVFADSGDHIRMRPLRRHQDAREGDAMTLELRQALEVDRVR
jgi:hypothetical protein